MTWPFLSRVIIDLPGDGDVIAPVEVLLHEGFTAFAVSPDAFNRTEILAIFSARASFIADHVRTPADVDAAAGWASALLLDTWAADVSDAASRSGLPWFLPALTPREIDDTRAAGGSGAQIVPANAFAATYADTLPTLFKDVPLIARMVGSVPATRRWLAHENVSTVTDGIITDDAFSGGDLGRLRARAREASRQFLH